MEFDESLDSEYATLACPLSSHPPLTSTSLIPDPNLAESEPKYPPTPLDQTQSLPRRKISSPFKGPFQLRCSRRPLSRSPRASPLSNLGWIPRASFPFTHSLLDLPVLYQTDPPPLPDYLVLLSPRGEWLERLVCRNEKKIWYEGRD